MSNNMEEMRDIATDMAEGMNMISENYNDLISIEEKIINLQKDINDIRSKSYISQNILEKCFERLGEIIVRTDDVSSASSETKNIKKVGLDMPSHSGKSQAKANADNIRTEDISLLKSKNISKGTQEMPILQKDKNLNNNSLAKDKNPSSGDNSPSKDKLLSKGENSDDIVDQRFSTCVPTRWARLAFCVVGKPLKKRFGVATYFCFILKGKNKIRKKNPKCDS